MADFAAHQYGVTVRYPGVPGSTPALFPMPAGGGGPTLIYKMRGRATVGGALTYWDSPNAADSTGALAPVSVTDIVVLKVV